MTATQLLIPSDKVITWNTVKTENGFKYVIALVGYQEYTLLKECDGFKSRAIAKSHGIKRRAYFKDCQKKQLLATIG